MDKLESGVVALETDSGPVYVQPSAWQRLYLVWTFRHFNSLPLKTLNSRQRRMVETLPRCGARARSGLESISVIGTVEGAPVPSFQMSSKVLEQKLELNESDDCASAEIECSGAKSFRHEAATRHAKTGRFRFSLVAAVVAISAIAAMAAWPRLHRVAAFGAARVATAGAAAEAQAGEKEPRPPAETASSPVLDAGSPAPAPAILTPAIPAAVGTDVSASKIAEAQNALSGVVAMSKAGVQEKPIAGNGLSPKPPVSSARGNTILASISIKESSDKPRMQVTGPPRKIIYPDYPATSVRGKVTLKAVIGADGRVRDVTILSGNRILSAAAARAIRQWRYDPIYKDGAPVETETQVGVVFVATDAISVTFPSAAAASQQ